MPKQVQSVSMRQLPIQPIHNDGNCVRRVPLFAGLTPQQQDLVAQVARPRLLSRGEVIRGEGDPANQMLVVHSGKIKVSRTLASGRQRILRVIEPGDTLDEHAFLHPKVSTDTAEASTESRLCVFSHIDLTDLIRQYPDIAVRLLLTLTQRLENAERQLSLSSIDVDSRVADYLLQLPLLPQSAVAARAQRVVQVQLPLPKKDVASILGTTPESLSRALKRLTTKGFVSVNDDQITILDAEGLEAQSLHS